METKCIREIIKYINDIDAKIFRCWNERMVLLKAIYPDKKEIGKNTYLKLLAKLSVPKKCVPIK